MGKLLDISTNTYNQTQIMNIISHLARVRTETSERKSTIRQHADRMAGERDVWVSKNAAYYDQDRQ
jgi:hypothetical protein